MSDIEKNESGLSSVERNVSDLRIASLDHETRIRRLEDGLSNVIAQIQRLEATVISSVNGVLGDAIRAVPNEYANRVANQTMWMTGASILIACVVGAAAIIVALR